MFLSPYFPSGPSLGHPPKEPGQKVIKRIRWDVLDRNCIEGKFCEGKWQYGLNLIKTELQERSETVIIMNLIVMNLTIATICKDRFSCFQEQNFA